MLPLVARRNGDQPFPRRHPVGAVRVALVLVGLVCLVSGCADPADTTPRQIQSPTTATSSPPAVPVGTPVPAPPLEGVDGGAYDL